MIFLHPSKWPPYGKYQYFVALGYLCIDAFFHAFLGRCWPYFWLENSFRKEKMLVSIRVLFCFCPRVPLWSHFSSQLEAPGWGHCYLESGRDARVGQVPSKMGKDGPFWLILSHLRAQNEPRWPILAPKINEKLSFLSMLWMKIWYFL